jgi:hypothetical protein
MPRPYAVSSQLKQDGPIAAVDSRCCGYSGASLPTAMVTCWPVSVGNPGLGTRLRASSGLHEIDGVSRGVRRVRARPDRLMHYRNRTHVR